MADETSVSGLPASHRRSFLAAALAALLFASATLAIAAPAVTTALTFERANATFASGDYRSAISQYKAILQRDGYSAPVLFNLGNAFYHDGQFGAAILNYERALVLAPYDSNIASNLSLAREQAGVTSPALGDIAKAARLISPNTQAWIGSLALLTMCLSIGVRRFRLQFYQAKIIIGFAIATMLAVATMFAIRWPEFDRAIVTAAAVPARIAPASTAAESFALKAGQEVTAVKTYGQFILVRTPDGRSGWVSETQIGLVFKARTNDGGTA